MKSYNFKNIDKIFAIGGMHGSYKEIFDTLRGYLMIKPEDVAPTHPKELERTLRRNKGMYSNIEEAKKELTKKLKKMSSTMSNPANKLVKGSLIVVLGDSGFGSTSEEKIIKFFTDKNKILAYNNVNIVFIRGNNDDPSYFDGEKIDFSNIKAVPDYSILETKDKNILCVGGAISADRMWKREQEKRVSKKLFWESEAPVFNPGLIKEAVDNFKHIDYVFSHSAPSFLNIGIDMSNIKDWEEKDKDLKKDIENERTCMDKVFETLRDNGSKPLFWGFGHFRNELSEKRSNTIFTSFSAPGICRTIDEEIKFATIHEMAMKMMPKKGKSLKEKSITLDDELARRLNEYNRAAMIDPQPFNEPQPVALGNNPFEGNFDDMFDAALDEDNRGEEFIEDHMEVGEEVQPFGVAEAQGEQIGAAQDLGFDLAAEQAEPMVEDEPVVEVGEPGENRPAVEEREEIRPITVAEMRRQWLEQHTRPIRITRDDDSEPLAAHRINRLYGNYIPYGGANGNFTFTLAGTNPVQTTTAQVANATTIANDTETARDNG